MVSTVHSDRKMLKYFPSSHDFSIDFMESCSQLMLEVQDLERHVNAAVLELIVTTFHETCEPMDRLVRAALKPAGVRSHLIF